MNLLSLLIAPLQAVVLFFAPHAVGAKPFSLRLPQRTLAQSNTAAPALEANSHSRALSPHARVTYPHNTAHISAKPIHRVRVVRNVDNNLPADRAGRMVVSGTFADVCAELDRLATTALHTT